MIPVNISSASQLYYKFFFYLMSRKKKKKEDEILSFMLEINDCKKFRQMIEHRTNKYHKTFDKP